MPFGWLAVVVLLGTIAGTIAIALLCHWILRYRSNEETSEELRQLFSVGAVLFSVIIGFLVVVTWQKYLDVEDNVVNEASAVQSAYEESRLLIDANGQTIRDGLRQYAEAVVDDEWPKLAVRQESAQAADSLAELWGAASGLQYADDGQITIGTSVAESLETISRERQSRLYESQVGLPWFFWAFMLAYAVFIVAMFNLFKNRRLGVRLWLNVVLGLSIGSVLLFILLIDFPFTGDTAIQPTAFEHALQHMR